MLAGRHREVLVKVPAVSPRPRPVFRVPRKSLAKQGFQCVSRAQSTTKQKREINVCIKWQRARRQIVRGWMDKQLENLSVSIGSILISRIDPKHDSQHHKGLRTECEIYVRR